MLELTLVEVQSSGAAPGPQRRAGGSAESPGARAQLGAPCSCARPSAGRPARYLQGARAAISSPSLVLKLRRLPCPPPPGEGPPSHSHPAASRPPPRRFPLATARSRLVPPPAARPSVALSITHTLFFRLLVRVRVTSEQSALSEGGAGADGLRWEEKAQLGRETAAVPGPGHCPLGIRAFSAYSWLVSRVLPRAVGSLKKISTPRLFLSRVVEEMSPLSPFETESDFLLLRPCSLSTAPPLWSSAIQ